MKFLALLASTLLIPLASCRIEGIAVPRVIKPGEGFNIKLLTSNYIQSVYDVSVAVGVAPGSGFPDALGSVLGSYYLGPRK